MNEFRVEVKVRNAILYNAIMREYKTVGEFSRANSINPSSVGYLLNLKESPLTKDGEWRIIAKRVADALNYEVSELFPDEIASVQLENNTSSLDVSVDVMGALISGDTGYNAVAQDEAQKAITSALDRLIPSHKKVLELRFGIDCEPMTLKETATELGVSQERIRQMQHKALSEIRRNKTSIENISDAYNITSQEKEHDEYRPI